MEAIYAFLFDLIGNDVSNLSYLLIPSFLIFVILLIVLFCVCREFSLLLLCAFFIMFLGFDTYICKYTLKTAASKNQAYVEAYIDSIKQETVAGKNAIVVDTKVIGRNGRKYLIEFEKDMLEKNYKAQSSHDGIVVYKKVNKVT